MKTRIEVGYYDKEVACRINLVKGTLIDYIELKTGNEVIQMSLGRAYALVESLQTALKEALEGRT